MLNQIVLVGRLCNIKDRDGQTIITLATTRSFENENGEYETDYIDFVLWGNIAKQVKDWCKEGDLIGIRGRIQTKEIDDTRITELIAEKVTFLSTKSEDIKEKIDENN